MGGKLGIAKHFSKGAFVKDTSPEMETRFFEMMMEKSGQERLKMGFSMFELARKQVIASILNENPKADSKEIRAKVFLRFYGQDFSPEEQERVLAQI